MAIAPQRLGAVLGLLAALSFGVSAPLSKLLLAEVSPQLLAGLLYLGAGIGLVGLRWQCHIQLSMALLREFGDSVLWDR